MNKITLQHGEGGKKSKELDNVFKLYFNHNISIDSPVFNYGSLKLAFTNDSFVVKPLFFRGGDIGSLCVNSTVNDLVAVGSKPLYLTCSMIIEEGFPYDTLIKIVNSIRDACIKAKVEVVTGDTKVVSYGECDGIYINTVGIGVIENHYISKTVSENDAIIITGPIADHGCTILLNRYNLAADSNLISDCNPLINLLDIVDDFSEDIKVMKNPKRGGVATIISELSDYYKYDIELFETEIPLRNEVRAVCCLLGIDPLYLPCVGRVVLVVSEIKAYEILSRLQLIEECKESAIIGRVRKANEQAYVSLKTPIGGRRIVSQLDDVILPRIC